LVAESAFVECIADEADGEDGDGECVAAVERFAACELRDGFFVVFGSCCDVPERRVEDYGGSGNWRSKWLA
jgi:hypothetical protein